MERKKLAPEEILGNLAAIKDWHAENDILSRRFEFANFAEALEFVSKVGAIAEKHDHHPRHQIRLGLRRNQLGRRTTAAALPHSILRSPGKSPKYKLFL